jgi:hypothetical protein
VWVTVFGVDFANFPRGGGTVGAGRGAGRFQARSELGPEMNGAMSLRLNLAGWGEGTAIQVRDLAVSCCDVGGKFISEFCH